MVPRLMLGRHGARSWATLIEPPGRTDSELRRAIEDELAELRHEPPPETLPDGFELSACIPHDEWKQLVAKAVGEMAGGSLAKVVLARQVEVLANRPFVLPEALSRLASLYPSCTVFHVEGFIGASPEVLVRRTGAEILSHPLAGTVARSGDPATDEALLAALMGSRKDRHEHQLVVDAIAAKLRPFCASLDVPKAPTVMPLRNVSHLGTEIRGALSTGSDTLAHQPRARRPPPADTSRRRAACGCCPALATGQRGLRQRSLRRPSRLGRQPGGRRVGARAAERDRVGPASRSLRGQRHRRRLRPRRRAGRDPAQAASAPGSPRPALTTQP